MERSGNTTTRLDLDDAIPLNVTNFLLSFLSFLSCLGQHCLAVICSIPGMPPRVIAVMGGMTRDLATLTDRLPNDGETVFASDFTEQPGGKGANAAVACYRLTRPNPKNRPEACEDIENDIHVRMVGAVGADGFGEPMKDNLIYCGVNVDGVRVIKGQRTAISNIILEKKS